jgi:hypothetical protein
MTAAPVTAVPMTAAPIFLPYVSTSDARVESKPMGHSAAVPPSAGAPTAEAPASLRLTDRGVAVTMVLAGVIMTVALVVIGLTALRVTSADYDAGSHTSPQVQN